MPATRSSALRPTQVRYTEPGSVLTKLDSPLSDTAERDNPVRAWLSLPRRIYLDTCTLQKLYDFGGEIFEGEPVEPVRRAGPVHGPAGEIHALRMLFIGHQRALFQVVVTAADLRQGLNR